MVIFTIYNFPNEQLLEREEETILMHFVCSEMNISQVIVCNIIARIHLMNNEHHPDQLGFKVQQKSSSNLPVTIKRTQNLCVVVSVFSQWRPFFV